MTARVRDGDLDAMGIAARLKEEIAVRRMSRQQLADAARISMSTLEKGLSGRRPFTLATVVRLERALDIVLRVSASGSSAEVGPRGSAPDQLGNYNRASVSWLEGHYLTLRPSFGEPGAVYSYRTDISWDERAGHLVFREAERTDQDFTQFGSVAVPHQSGHIYLVTNRHGQHRLIVVARPAITGIMYGILTTLQAGRGAHLSPVATPIAMRPVRADERPQFGRIPKGHPAFAGYAKLLAKTTAEGFAAFLDI